MVPELLRHRNGRPPMTIPLVTAPPATQAGELGVTWLGHATALIELDGQYVLTDPVWGQRVSPSELRGPGADASGADRAQPICRRWPPWSSPTTTTTIWICHRADADGTQAAPFVVPLGIGAHLRGWGVPRTGSSSWTGASTPPSADSTSDLYAEAGTSPAAGCAGTPPCGVPGPWPAPSSGVLRRRHRVHRRVRGDRPPVGARSTSPSCRSAPTATSGRTSTSRPRRRWPRTATSAVRLFVPIHWATFDLALHTWAEPMDRLRAAGADAHIAAPRPGQRVDPKDVLARMAGGTTRTNDRRHRYDHCRCGSDSYDWPCVDGHREWDNGVASRAFEGSQRVTGVRRMVV